MITLEDIIKQNSLLPPIIDTQSHRQRFSSNHMQASNRPNNFAIPSKRKQMQSIGLINSHYNSVANQIGNNVTPTGGQYSGGYSRRRVPSSNQNQILLKKNFNLPAVSSNMTRQSPGKAQTQTKPLSIMNYNTNQVYSGKASLPNPPTYSLGKSSSQQRLASNAAI